MNHKELLKLAATLALSASLFACKSTPPVELIDARQAYAASEKGPAAQYAQSHLQVAKNALTKAEQAFKEDGNEPTTRDLAYVAQRSAQIADVQARVAIAKRDKTEADRNLDVASKQIQNQTVDELARTKEALADTNAQRSMSEQQRMMDQEKLAEKEKTLDKAQAQLDIEKKARIEAEKRSAEARTELARVAQVRDDERGMVINLAGNVLFASGKSQLLTSSHVQLTQVTTALKAMPEKRILIEGHTDSVGSDDTNQRLSQLRAEAVRDFLVRNGIAREQIEAVGIGESRPAADNATAEGRAINRRVEIVLRDAQS